MICLLHESGRSSVQPASGIAAGCPECGYACKLCRLEDRRWKCAGGGGRKQFDLLTNTRLNTRLARERFSLPEIYELLHWIELELTDQDIARWVEAPYHRGHRFFLKLLGAIHAFGDEVIRLLDGAVEVDETYLAASFEGCRAGKRVRLGKAGKVNEAGAPKGFSMWSSASTSGPTGPSTATW